jgi:Zn ribbon nucleic-acid-binding protein
MTPDRLTSFVAVREALNKTDSQYTPLLTSLIDDGKNNPFACKPTARQAFGPKKDDFPSLGKKQSPFDSNALPSLKELQELLVSDLLTARESCSHYINEGTQPAKSGSQTDDDEQLKHLKSLTDNDHDTRGGILSFPSPSFDKICDDGKVEYDGVVRESMTVASILSRDTLLPLQHSNEGTTFTTLLSGSVAWIIWPPTKQNLEILQTSYNVSAADLDDTRTNVPHELVGGVCLVQTIGDAIRIPPFCPLMCLSLERSVIATHFVVTATQLANMLHKLPLLLAWFKTEIDGERKKNDFVAALLPHLSTILQGDFEPVKLRHFEHPYEQEGPLRVLLEGWDEVKHAVASILCPSETQKVIAMWAEFLVNAKGRKCWICGWSTRNKQRDLPKHFELKHWHTEDVAEAVERYEGTLKKPQKTTVPQGIAEKGLEDTFHDAMEIIELSPGAPRERAGEAVTSYFAQEQATEPDDDGQMEVDKGRETPVHFC